jgi:uncharacterized protein YgbK (DUF1537 family)
MVLGVHLKTMKGKSLKTETKSMDMEQLLAEAEELIQEINEDVIKEMEEENRLQFELYTQKFKEIKTKVQSKTSKERKSEASSIGEGMHEAILDIIKSMREMTSYRFSDA